MNINPIAANIYKSNSIGQTVHNLRSDSSTQADTRRNGALGRGDSISISQEAISQSEMGKLVKEIAAEIASSTPQQKVDALSRWVESGEYNVPASLVADSILSY